MDAIRQKLCGSHHARRRRISILKEAAVRDNCRIKADGHVFIDGNVIFLKEPINDLTGCRCLWVKDAGSRRNDVLEIW